MAKKSFDKRSSLWRNYIEPLANDGYEAIIEAIKTNEFQNRTGNLEDSYASAVYYDGYMVEGTMRFFDPTQATEGKKWDGEILRGREEARKYLLNYRPRTKGLSLILIAAMPYGEILEKGQGYLYRKYKVVAGANSFMRQLAQKWEGKFGRKAKGVRVNVTPVGR